MLDENLFPNNPIPIIVGPTPSKNTIAAFSALKIFGKILDKHYLISDKDFSSIDYFTEWEVACHETRHRVQHEFYEQEFRKWNWATIDVAENISNSSKKFVSLLQEFCDNPAEIDARAAQKLIKYYLSAINNQKAPINIIISLEILTLKPQQLINLLKDFGIIISFEKKRLLSRIIHKIKSKITKGR